VRPCRGCHAPRAFTGTLALDRGTHQFIYSDKCTISLERRTLPGEVHEDLLKDLEDILNRLRDDDDKFSASVRTVMTRNPHEISQDAEIVRVVTDSASRVLGRTPRYIGHHWWEDSALIADSGTETVIIGSKGAGIHSQEEWVDIQSVVDLAQILAQSAMSYCS
jgi:acetylornithine deacetylase